MLWLVPHLAWKQIVERIWPACFWVILMWFDTISLSCTPGQNFIPCCVSWGTGQNNLFVLYPRTKIAFLPVCPGVHDKNTSLPCTPGQNLISCCVSWGTGQKHLFVLYARTNFHSQDKNMSLSCTPGQNSFCVACCVVVLYPGTCLYWPLLSCYWCLQVLYFAMIKLLRSSWRKECSQGGQVHLPPG